MRGRPRLPVGSYGDIRTTTAASGGVKATAQYRDTDGHTREYSRTRPTKAKAIAALREYLKAKPQRTSSLAITASTTMDALAKEYFARLDRLVKAGNRSASTLRLYRGHWRNHIAPAVGALTIAEADVHRLDSLLVDLREHSSAHLCKTVRAVLSGMMGLAVRRRAIPANPVRDVEDIPGDGSGGVKTLTAADAVDVWQKLTTLARTPNLGAINSRYRETMCDPMIPDLWLFLLCTGCRISQAIGVHWPQVDLADPEHATVRIGPNVIRVPGEGLRLSEGTSKSREAVIGLPEQAVMMLLRRRQAKGGPVFPDAFGGLLDPSNVSSKKLRPALKAIGYGRVTSHYVRRSVGSELNEAGLSAREVADVLGHADSRVTEKHYMRPYADNPRAKAAITRMLSTAPQRRVVGMERREAH